MMPFETKPVTLIVSPGVIFARMPRVPFCKRMRVAAVTWISNKPLFAVLVDVVLDAVDVEVKGIGQVIGVLLVALRSSASLSPSFVVTAKHLNEVVEELVELGMLAKMVAGAVVELMLVTTMPFSWMDPESDEIGLLVPFTFVLLSTEFELMFEFILRFELLLVLLVLLRLLVVVEVLEVVLTGFVAVTDPVVVEKFPFVLVVLVVFVVLVVLVVGVVEDITAVPVPVIVPVVLVPVNGKSCAFATSVVPIRAKDAANNNTFLII